MALTPEQTAILELLLGGPQSFAELGELLGLDEAEVRLRTREALGELGGADPDRSVALSGYLVGRADPIDRADAVRHLRQDAADHELASAIVARLREISPQAELPALPAAPGQSRRPAAPARVRRDGGERGGPAAVLASLRGSRLYGALAAAAVVLVAVVLAVSGVFSGDDETAATDDPATEQPGEVAGEEVERIPLEPVGNGDASGEGVVGITTGDQPYLDLRLQNLEPAPRDQVYVVWFLFDERNGYPLSPIAPDNRGSYEDRFAIPSAALPVLQRMRFLNVSLAPATQVSRIVNSAIEEGNVVLSKPGRTVLQNPTPLSAGGGAGGGAGTGG